MVHGVHGVNDDQIVLIAASAEKAAKTVRALYATDSSFSALLPRLNWTNQRSKFEGLGKLLT